MLYPPLDNIRRFNACGRQRRHLINVTVSVYTHRTLYLVTCLFCYKIWKCGVTFNVASQKATRST